MSINNFGEEVLASTITEVVVLDKPIIKRVTINTNCKNFFIVNLLFNIVIIDYFTIYKINLQLKNEYFVLYGDKNHMKY
ncbi:hypothetical protein Ctaglu_40480 [Clostridium tagluense]|uniref:Uncharacterized protein n=1 Tax=Clostridium tagluense TaxID=360422 RepID=A0A401USA0_9CLOT|nr:hypothetical protein Ctaglu_40480 [Clostridium tagluense]